MNLNQIKEICEEYDFSFVRVNNIHKDQYELQIDFRKNVRNEHYHVAYLIGNVENVDEHYICDLCERAKTEMNRLWRLNCPFPRMEDEK